MKEEIYLKIKELVMRRDDWKPTFNITKTSDKELLFHMCLNELNKMIDKEKLNNS